MTVLQMTKTRLLSPVQLIQACKQQKQDSNCIYLASLYNMETLESYTTLRGFEDLMFPESENQKVNWKCL